MYNRGNRLQWVSELINIREYTTRFYDQIPVVRGESSTTLPQKEVEKIKLLSFMNRLCADDDWYHNLSESCSQHMLDVPNEPPAVDVESIKAKRGLFDGSKVPNNVNLCTLNHLNESGDKLNESLGNLKYTSTIWVNDGNGGKNDLKVNEDILLIIRVYEPFHYVNGIRNLRPINCMHEIGVLGNQTLDKLRDKIVCPSGYAVEGDLSENPNAIADRMAKDIFRSGFIFIEDTFYNDFRHKDNIDYSAVIINWAQGRKMGPFKKAEMDEVTFFDLSVRFGYPYVYQHLGNCEHLIVFSDARLLHSSDSLCSLNYPKFLTLSGKKTKYCMICKFYAARWVTLENIRVPNDPCYFCDTCFKMFNYKDGEKIGNFKAYVYQDRASVI